MKIEYLYKYRPINENTLDMVRNSELYFSSPFEFNDPFDCRPNFDMEGSLEDYVKLYKRIIKNKNPQLTDKEIDDYTVKNMNIEIIKNKEMMEGFIKESITLMMNTVRLFCLSEVNDDILMYSHYANNHKGVCLEFNLNEKDAEQVHKVNYQSKLPSISFVNDFGMDVNEFVKVCLLTKSEHWSYEKEHRFLNFLPKEKVVKFKKTFLTGIIFGCEVSEADKLKIKNLVSKYGYEIKFYQARKKKKEYGLDIINL